MLVLNQVVCVSFLLPPFSFLSPPLPHHHTSYHMDFTPIFKFFAPKCDLLEPPPSSYPILTDGYELRPTLIAMVWEKSFSGSEDEDPYTHLREFEQLCSCQTITGMTQETIKWKLFLFSLLGRARKWYDHSIRGINRNWDELRDNFCLAFFPMFRITDVRIEVLTFKQKEKETLGAAWARFITVYQF